MNIANSIAQDIWLNGPVHHSQYASGKDFINPVTEIIHGELRKYALVPKELGSIVADALLVHAKYVTTLAKEMRNP